MSIASLLAGITLAIVGLLIWKFKLVKLLAGYHPNTNTNNKRLATFSGLSLMLVGFCLLVDSFLIFKGIIRGETGVLVVVGTIILGSILVSIITSYYSKH